MILTEIEPIKFVCSNSLLIYLFDQLYKHKFINGKIKVKKFLDEINAVDIKLNGRINPETILLKTVD